MTLRGAAVLAALAWLVGIAAGPALAACPDCLRAGAARVEFRIPDGAPLAGYGALARRQLIPDLFGPRRPAFWLKPATGALDPLAARAVVLESDRVRLAWVALDLVGVDATFTSDLARRAQAAGMEPATFLVSASHTHSGPGAFVDSTLFAVLVLDRLDRRVRDALLDAAVNAVMAADRTRRPAVAGVASVTGPPVTKSRLDRPLDRDLVVMRLDTPEAEPIALVWSFAIHGTMLGPGNHALSGDVSGAASRRLEKALGIPALFVNGAVGDVSPAEHGLASIPGVAGALADAAREAWRQAPMSPSPGLAVARRNVALPAPALSLRRCVGRMIPRGLVVPLGSALPRRTELVAVGVGDAGWVSVPGELQTALGRTLKDGARPSWRVPVVAGLTNDYLGYFVTPEDAERTSYVTCASVYGPETGACLTRAAGELLTSLRERAGAEDAIAEAPCARDGDVR
jgi:neutral/alkaline ceramidase-like enzyme